MNMKNFLQIKTVAIVFPLSLFVNISLAEGPQKDLSKEIASIPKANCTFFKSKKCNFNEVLKWEMECGEGEGKDESCIKVSNFTK